jgi:hypothetical protein
MNEAFFNADKELKQLYLNRGMTGNLKGEEVKQTAQDKYAGMNKKMRLRMKNYERMTKGKHSKTSSEMRKMILVQPEKEWAKD